VNTTLLRYEQLIPQSINDEAQHHKEQFWPKQKN